jgi:hypothetical protein
MNQRLAAPHHHHHHHQARRHSGRRSLRRSNSRHSLTSVGSGDVFFATPPKATPPHSGRSHGSQGRPGGSARESRGGSGVKREKAVSVWKGDSQILAIDLKRELTSKVT